MSEIDVKDTDFTISVSISVYEAYVAIAKFIALLRTGCVRAASCRIEITVWVRSAFETLNG